MEHFLETLMFRSRWLLAPFYLGLVGGLVVLLVKFGQEFLHVLLHLMDASEREVVLALLSLVDITLVANLLLMVIFSGYENFVSKIHTANHEDRPDWMGKVDYSGLKLKLIGSIVAWCRKGTRYSARIRRGVGWTVAAPSTTCCGNSVGATCRGTAPGNLRGCGRRARCAHRLRISPPTNLLRAICFFGRALTTPPWPGGSVT